MPIASCQLGNREEERGKMEDKVTDTISPSTILELAIDTGNIEYWQHSQVLGSFTVRQFALTRKARKTTKY